MKTPYQKGAHSRPDSLTHPNSSGVAPVQLLGGSGPISSKGSLGGQNSPGRGSGARSSRALSTLFKQLQKLDREIARMDAWPCFKFRKPSGLFANCFPFPKGAEAKRAKLDQKRKEIRSKRKGTPSK